MPEPTPKTKVCESCDAVIGESEKECPKCKVNFEELEDAVTTVSTAQAVLAKRKAKEIPPPPPPPVKKVNPLRALGQAIRKGKS
jgi:RNA polymerase subunit RPABC4/transcription elongation factor Spt4